ncbi:MAG: NAD-dependent epimerase/dehydratase family protein [Caulobacteraceae bacterium]|nr:NAD-dependent epimerase/dehydratase family protein [Caulobacteraceae bacterium]
MVRERTPGISTAAAGSHQPPEDATGPTLVAREEFWRDRRVFVTGASGFLGKWIVRELNARGASVVRLLRDGTNDGGRGAVVLGCLEDFDCLARALRDNRIETVLHLGAQPIVGTAFRDPLGTFEANIRGTWNILEACRQTSTVKRLVIASSDRAYGAVKTLPYDESMPLAGRHPYDASKICADILGQTYCTTYGLPVTMTRSANLYGGGDLNFNRIVPGVIQSVLKGERPILRSDGTIVRDYIYIRDVVGAYLLLAEAMDEPRFWGRAYNFSVEAPLSVLGITRKILEVMGRPDLEPVILGQAQSETSELYLSAARARRELGWRHAYSLDEGLAETVAWYRLRAGIAAVGAGPRQEQRHAETVA